MVQDLLLWPADKSAGPQVENPEFAVTSHRTLKLDLKYTHLSPLDELCAGNVAMRHKNIILAVFIIVAIVGCGKSSGARSSGLLTSQAEISQTNGRSGQPGTDAILVSGPVCGRPDDQLPHLPPNWDTFTPPAVGQSYLDLTFGCPVKRLTNSSTDETTWDGKHLSFMNYYSTLTPMNATDTMLLITSSNGAWRIRDVQGKIVIPAAKMPAFSGHPVWDAADENIFYYTFRNSLYRATVASKQVNSGVVHTFNEYDGVTSPDSADLSQDGDHIALIGKNRNNTIDVLVWSLRRRAKTSVYTTSCSISGTVTSTSQPGCVHKLQLTANNLLTIGFAQEGRAPEEGVRLWNGSTLIHLQDKTDHYDTGYDLNGNSVFIACNNFMTLPGITNPCASGWGMDVRQINNLVSGICLLDHQPYWHVSYRGSVAQPWAAMSFFDSRTPGPEFFSGDGRYQRPTTGNWQLYEDEIVVAKVDATRVYRLAHARSRSMESYWSQPHAAISRDGKYVVFSSNMAYPNGCPANMHVADECSDVYMIKLH